MTNDDRIDKLAAFVKDLARYRNLTIDFSAVAPSWEKDAVYRSIGRDAHAVLKECGLA